MVEQYTPNARYRARVTCYATIPRLAHARSGHVRPLGRPVPIVRVRPSYTSAAMAARLAGVALVECVVMRDGTVDQVRVVRSFDSRFGLDQEAVKAARQSRFRPGTVDGHPVAVRLTIELSFSIY
jgi:TonB family protein